MKHLLVFLPIVLVACEAILPSNAMDDVSVSNSKTISFPCDDKSVQTTEWVYCDPVEFDLSGYPVKNIVMYFSLRVAPQNTDKVIAELYDLNNDSTIPLSQVESVISYVQHTRTTPDLSDFLARGHQKLAIRFRVNRDGAVGFISTGSRLVVKYKD